MSSDADVLRVALRKMASLSLADVLFGGYVSRGELTISNVLGTKTPLVQGQFVRPGQGLGGAAMSELRPVRVSDYFASQHITHQFDEIVRAEGLLSMAAFPLLSGQSIRGVLYAASRERFSLGSHAMGEFQRAAMTISRELVIRDEVERRVALLRQAQHEDLLREQEFVGRVREAYAELKTCAATSADPRLAHRLNRLLERLERVPVQPDSSALRLSRRQRDVLAQVAQGYEYSEVGKILGLQLTTVRSYMRTILSKLGCRNRVEAVAIARKHGLLS